MKGVIPRPQAEYDFDDALSYYANENSAIAMDFLRDVHNAYSRISEMPGIGSPRFQRTLDVDDLRAYSLHTFPYIIFYIDREKHIDVVRVLHSHRDILTLFLQQ